MGTRPSVDLCESRYKLITDTATPTQSSAGTIHNI